MTMPDPSLQPDAVTAFLATTPPFDRLSPVDLAQLAAAGRVALYLEGETIAEPDAAEPVVCCVQRGGVVFVPPGQDRQGGRLTDVRGEGECFGLAGALPGCPDGCQVAAAADTFLVRLPGSVFAAVAARNPQVAAYFDNCLASRVCPVAGDIAAATDVTGGADGDYLFTRQAGEVASRGVVGVVRGTNLRQTARTMEEASVGSVVVREVSGTVIGIVTDRDLRRAVARGLGLDAAVETLMSAPVAAIDAATPCFEALSHMTESGFRHLLVTTNGEPAGLVTANDLLLAHGRSPMALLRSIRRAASLDDLAALARRSFPLAAALAARGATAATVGGLLAMTAQGVLGRLLDLLVRECGLPPGRWCWLALGAAGRREMLPGMGLSLAVAADCGGDDIVARAMDTYCRAVLPILAGWLEACGLGGTRLAGPIDLAGLRAFLHDGPDFKRLDVRIAAGDSGLAEAVRAVLIGCRPEARSLAAGLRRHLACPVPLGVHQGRLAERHGGFAPVFDVAERGTRPVVVMARLAGLLWGAPGPGTSARLQSLAAAGRLAGPVVQSVLEAFAFFEGERLLARLSGQSGDPDVVVRPGALSARRRQEYRIAFGAVEALRLALLDALGAGEGRS
ncbi:CBS domain-containing protein [Desulfovibrio sp. TomC]|uniref:CBS domain-containing protein n=1 Tax=Desulfovibrio sp. TomC TaxID=1562888 RepID=UPI000573DE1A|nr:CBS domain-containing protein [Desulfovibrio sp. TomC]KHK00956.1 hypothetical protein NY78_3626 [Desulfovibrio sp. TomC]